VATWPDWRNDACAAAAALLEYPRLEYSKRPAKGKGYPADYGYGADEWNFCIGDAFEGHVYGHTPYSPSPQVQQALGATFCVAFWTKDPTTCDRLLVGFYENAQWTSEGQSAAFDRFLRKGRPSRWTRRFEEVLSVSNSSRRDIRAELHPGGHTWKFRCVASGVRLLDRPIPLKGVSGYHQRFSKSPVLNNAKDALETTVVYGIREPSRTAYDGALMQLQGLGDTDCRRERPERLEQRYLQSLLFRGVKEAPCSLCGRILPISFLVTAHIKPRSRCSDAERKDLNNVTAACVLGCDYLFDRGFVVVKDNSVQSRLAQPNSADVHAAIGALIGRRLPNTMPWTAARAKYFAEHELLVASWLES